MMVLTRRTIKLDVKGEVKLVLWAQTSPRGTRITSTLLKIVGWVK
jgi:hypothetical protein